MNNNVNEDLLLKYINANARAEYIESKIEEKEAIRGFGYRCGYFMDRTINHFKGKVRAAKNKRYFNSLIDFEQMELHKSGGRERKIICSLTSYPERLEFLPFSLASILRQTEKPDKVILWLGEERKENRELPGIFKKYEEKGLEIRYVPDIKTHTKWYYAFKEYPHDLIITLDDDIVYDDCIVKKLYKAHKKFPNYTPALRAHRMRFDDEYNLLDYRDWVWEYKGGYGMTSNQLFITGCGSALYQPDKMVDEVMDLDVIREYCESHDDFWLTLMSILSKRKPVLADNIGKVQGRTILGAQKTAMWRVNVIKGGGMRMINQTLPLYENFWGKDTSLVKAIALDDLQRAK